jgi:hypothetical protein
MLERDRQSSRSSTRRAFWRRACHGSSCGQSCAFGLDVEEGLTEMEQGDFFVRFGPGPRRVIGSLSFRRMMVPTGTVLLQSTGTKSFKSSRVSAPPREEGRDNSSAKSRYRDALPDSSGDLCAARPTTNHCRYLRGHLSDRSLRHSRLFSSWESAQTMNDALRERPR